jgi:methionyl-tRNA synthetase
MRRLAISSTKEWAFCEGKDWEPYWKDQIQNWFTLWKDNIVFHCVHFPSDVESRRKYFA